MFKEFDFSCVNPEYEFANLLYRTLGACVDIGATLIPGVATAGLVIRDDEEFRAFAREFKMAHLEHPFQYDDGELTALYDQVQQELASSQCHAMMVLKRGAKIYLVTQDRRGAFDILEHRLRKVKEDLHQLDESIDLHRRLDKAKT